MTASADAGTVHERITKVAAKRCSRCNVDKPLDEFKRDRKYRDGHASYCRACHSEYAKEWQRRNPEKVKESRRRYIENNPEYRQKGKARGKRWRDKNVHHIRWYHIKRKFGLSQEAYQELLSAQDGVCAICGKRDPNGKWLHVDHDHTCCPATPTCGSCTRGLLCGPCNLSLAALERKGDWLARATSYLSAHGEGGAA